MTNRQAAIKIIRRLHRNGFQALLAGGCVRDMLLRRRANDYDVATDARPPDVIKLFKRTLKVGAKFGVVIVLIEGRQVEVATFRTEAGYADGRHPGSVAFAGAAEDAIKKADEISQSTACSMILCEERSSTTSMDGEILSAASCEPSALPPSASPRTTCACCEPSGSPPNSALPSSRPRGRRSAATREKITHISGERIAIELEGILAHPNRAAGASMLIESGLSKAIFPGFAGKQARFAIDVLKHLPKRVDFPLALAAFFSGCEMPFAVERCRLLKLSRNQNKHIKSLLVGRGKLLNDKMSLAELKKILAQPTFWDLYNLQKAIQKAQHESIGALISLRKRIKALGDVDLQPKPLLSGHDLIRLGAAPGPALGQLAEELYIAQLEGTLQTPQQAKEWARRWLQKHTAHQ